MCVYTHSPFRTPAFRSAARKNSWPDDCRTPVQDWSIERTPHAFQAQSSVDSRRIARWGALIAQVSKPPASVLPTGGGQALLDPSDTRDPAARSSGRPVPDREGHQRRRAAREHHDAREARDAAEDPRHHDRVRAQRPERAADAGDPSVRAARGLRAAQGRGERLGQRGLRQGGARHRPQDADHGGRLDQRLRDVPGARRQGGRASRCMR